MHLIFCVHPRMSRLYQYLNHRVMQISRIICIILNNTLCTFSEMSIYLYVACLIFMPLCLARHLLIDANLVATSL